MWSEVVVACTVCFGAADGPLIASARLGVLVMVGVTCAVLAGFAAFFARLAQNGDSPRFAAGNGDCPRFLEPRKIEENRASDQETGTVPVSCGEKGDSPRFSGIG